VSVTHDGKTVETVTSEDGSFAVADVRSGPVSVKVSAEGFDFDVVSVSDVAPGVTLPVIAPARYLLTGKVERDSLPIDTEVIQMAYGLFTRKMTFVSHDAKYVFRENGPLAENVLTSLHLFKNCLL
jgi:hypothetical protein